MASVKSLSIPQYKRENARLVKLLKQATTQEPRSSGANWVSGSSRNMVDVITFRQSGRGKGSLERFVEANNIPKPVYNRMRAAVAAAAHRQQASGGVVAFKVTAASLKSLQSQLDKMATGRDKSPKDGKLTGKELTSFAKLANGKATTARGASAKLKATGLRGNQTEHKFSRQVNYLLDLLYSNGSINGRDHIDRLVEGMSPTNEEAVRAGYASVSRYISKGRSGAMNFICRDQRQEVQRGLMRTFGASQDRTELAIAALKLPRGY